MPVPLFPDTANDLLFTALERLPHELVRLGSGHGPLDPKQHPNAIPMASLARFKGLEADAVALCEVRAGSKACTERHLHLGASRARHLLLLLS